MDGMHFSDLYLTNGTTGIGKRQIYVWDYVNVKMIRSSARIGVQDSYHTSYILAVIRVYTRIRTHLSDVDVALIYASLGGN